MAIVFLDSSALLKLYMAEKGSVWLKEFVKSQLIAISELAIYESANVLRRRYIEGTISREDAIDIFGQINRQSATYNIAPLGGADELDSLLKFIFNLPNTLRIRTLDSIHLNAAWQIYTTVKLLQPEEEVIFVSADAKLLAVAQAQGLATENPENHPDAATPPPDDQGQI